LNLTAAGRAIFPLTLRSACRILQPATAGLGAQCAMARGECGLVERAFVWPPQETSFPEDLR
jgi:hypothetical protein